MIIYSGMKRYILILAAALLPLIAEAQIKIWDGTSCNAKQVTLTEYLPEGEPRAAIIICPGGSYHWLDQKGEGSMVAQALADEGYVAYVLRYRVAGKLEFVSKYRSVLRGHRHPDMICDLQRAIQIVRTRYSCPLGLIGFSAGGHLAMMGAEFFSTNFLEKYKLKPAVSLRPDFAAAIYPVVTMSDDRYVHKRSRLGLLGERNTGKKELRDSLSVEKHVRADMPPVFILNCQDDDVVDCQNSVLLDSALSAAHVPHHYIQYAEGGHGFGVNPEKYTEETQNWFQEFLSWLHNMSF